MWLTVNIPLLNYERDTRMVTVTDDTNSKPPLPFRTTADDLSFNISRISSYGTLPLTSTATLSSANVTSLLDGSSVSCWIYDYSLHDITAQVVSPIHVISTDFNGTLLHDKNYDSYNITEA